MKKTYLLLAFVLLSTLTFAQKKQKDTIRLDQFNHEIGWDMQHVLSNTIVSSVLYRKRIKKTNPAKPHRFKYWRFAANLSGVFTNAQDTTIEINGRSLDVEKTENHGVRLSVGREWLNHRWDRFSFYFGADLVLHYDRDESIYNTTFSNRFVSVIPGHWALPERGDRIFYEAIRVGLAPLFGAKIHLSRRISLSVETQLNLFYKFYNIHLSSTDLSLSDFEMLRYKDSELEYYLDQLNMLSLNYAF